MNSFLNFKPSGNSFKGPVLQYVALSSQNIVLVEMKKKCFDTCTIQVGGLFVLWLCAYVSITVHHYVHNMINANFFKIIELI